MTLAEAYVFSTIIPVYKMENLYNFDYFWLIYLLFSLFGIMEVYKNGYKVIMKLNTASRKDPAEI